VASTVEFRLEPPLKFIQAQAGRFRANLLDFHALWERFGRIMAEFEQQWFGSHGQGAWPPLAESTLRYKTGPDVMRETDALYESLIDPGAALRTSRMEASYGTDVEYAHWHQEGGSIPGRPPQRQVIPDPIPLDLRRLLEQAQVQWINEVAATTFGRI
jgi:phage gpG-like protein